MGLRVTRGDFRDDAQWSEWQRDCQADHRKFTGERQTLLANKFAMLLKHDVSLVGRIIVIPPEYVHLLWQKKDFAHLL